MRTKFSTLFRCTGAVALLALAAGLTPQPASAQNLCVQDEYQLVNKQKLNCTANDVRIAKVTNVRDPITGAAITTCIAGQNFNFLADFEILTTSSQARENIGLYIATQSQTQALTGACVDNIISPQHPCPSNNSLNCGSDNYHETDPQPDNCGDTSKGDLSATFGAAAERVTLEIDNFLCEAPAGSNQVQLPNCTSWQIPGGTIQCVSPSPTFPYPVDANNKPEAIPGSPSKCNCAIIPLGVTVQTPGINVGKACTVGGTTPSTPNPPTFSLVSNQLTGSPANCSLNPEGGTVTYTIEIANDASNFGSVVVDQICDGAYGNVFTVAGFSGQPCGIGSQCTGANAVAGGYCGGSTNGCGASTIAKGSSQLCTFQVNQPEGTTVDNIASVVVHGTSAGTASGGSNQVEVISHEATTSGTIAKTFVANTAACATVTYQVVVTNTSAAGTDETLTLNSLSDNTFGDLTKCAGTQNGCDNSNLNVLGTTCGVATGSPGLGTLSTSTGGGTLPSSSLAVNGGAYTCQFNAQFCGGLTSIDLGNGQSCVGFQHSNNVSANLTGDEASDVVSLTPGSLTVKECVTPH